MWFHRILSWIFFLISILVLFIIPIYFISSLIEIFQNPSYVGGVLNCLLLVIELIGYLFAFYLFYMISGAFSFRFKSPISQKTPLEPPFFSVIVPSHGTPFSTLKQTLHGALNIKYENFEVIVSDNGQDPDVTNQLKVFCKENHIPFFHKPDSRGFKAGNINAVLDKTQGDFIVILDSDHVADPHLLTEFSRLDWNEELGYVQMKVSYRNTKKLYQAANSILYSQFFEVFEAAKDQRGVVLFNGTTGCFRRDVLIEVGGFAEDTLIEDIDTSMKILSKGYQGRYLDFVGSEGLVPESAKAQIAQLWRWSHGACSLLRLRLRLILFSSNLSWTKKFELVLNAMAFFSGISIIFFVFFLALLIIGDIPFLRNNTLLGFHLGYLMPVLVSVSYSIAAVLAIIWEPRRKNVFTRLLELIPFYLFSLGAFLFLISGVIEGLLLRNTPLREGSVWNRQIHSIRDSFLALCICIILLIIGVLNIGKHEFAFFVIGGVIGWLLAPLVLLYEEIIPLKS